MKSKVLDFILLLKRKLSPLSLVTFLQTPFVRMFFKQGLVSNIIYPQFIFFRYLGVFFCNNLYFKLHFKLIQKQDTTKDKDYEHIFYLYPRLSLEAR